MGAETVKNVNGPVRVFTLDTENPDLKCLVSEVARPPTAVKEMGQHFGQNLLL